MHNRLVGSEPDVAGVRGTSSEPLDVVVIPDTPWDRIVWTNRQHVMRRLPECDRGVRILYLAPPRLFTRPLSVRAREPHPSMWTARVAERVWVAQPLLPVPRRFAALLPLQVDQRLLLAVGRRAARRLGFDRPCVWTYAPQYADFVGAFNERWLIYDIVDDYSAMPYYRHTLGPRVDELDRRLTQRADLVFVVNDFLFAQRRAWNPSVRHVGNAGDVTAFAQARTSDHVPNELRDIRSPVIGFHGTLTGEKLDLPLLEKVISQRPDWTFVFIGPAKDPDASRRLGRHPNVLVCPAVESAVLPDYVAQFNVLLIPYKRTAYTGRPLKVYEGLAAGVPIVATGLPELSGEPGIVVPPATAGAVASAIDEILASSPRPVPLQDIRRYSWEAKAARQLSAVRQLIEMKPS